MNVNPFGHIGDNLNCIHCHHQLNQHWQDNDGFYRCPHCSCKEKQVTPLIPKQTVMVTGTVMIKRREDTSMSAVNLCDRCGNLALGKAIAVVNFYRNPDEVYRSDGERYEMCPECAKEMDEFLKENPERPNRRPFKKPYVKAEDKAPKELESGE